MMFAQPFRRWRDLARLWRDARGVAAVELALLAPLFLLVLAGTAGIGLDVVSRIKVNEAVSAAAHGALVAAPSLSASSVDDTAASLATILRRAWNAPEESELRIEFNGARTYRFAGREASVAGQASAVDECRCPISGEGVLEWGGKAECGKPCPDLSLSARYVLIAVSVPPSPVFASFVPGPADGIRVQTLVALP